LAANNDLSARIAQEAAERELAQKDAVEARWHLEAEKSRAAAELAELRKMIKERDEKISFSVTELAALQAAKNQAEAELDENYEESEELLKQCFDRAVRQAHVFFGGRRPLVNSTLTSKLIRVGWYRLPRWGLWWHKRLEQPGPRRGNVLRLKIRLPLAGLWPFLAFLFPLRPGCGFLLLLF